ncbi:MAG: hypothetical protein WBK08_18105 [Nitrospira sp.]|nr:MAG: hypothetical protein E8D42_13210 [Nitrospira sp.]
MRMFVVWVLSISLAPVLLPAPSALAEGCAVCCTNNCQDCSACTPMTGDEAAVGTTQWASTPGPTGQGLTADAPPFVVAAVVKCSECMGKCSTAYYNCKSQCAPNDRACLIQCQELSGQCQQNCKDVLQCE